MEAQSKPQPKFITIPFEEKKKRKFTPLPYSYKYVINYLVNKGLLQLLKSRPPPNPLPPGYDATKHCQFHQTLGHPVDKCFILKHDIQDLIDERNVSFGPPLNNPPNSSILQNPLSSHPPSKGTNMIGVGSQTFNPPRRRLYVVSRPS